MLEKPIYHIILLRHGESIGNAKGLFQGHAVYKLSQNGGHQAQLLAAYWKQIIVIKAKVVAMRKAVFKIIFYRLDPPSLISDERALPILTGW